MVRVTSLARELNMSHDWFESVMLTRERQTDWLADLVESEHRRLAVACHRLHRDSR